MVVLLCVLISAIYLELGMEKRNACRFFVEKLIEFMPPWFNSIQNTDWSV